MRLLQPRLGQHMAPSRAARLQAEGPQTHGRPPASRPQPRAGISHASVQKQRTAIQHQRGDTWDTPRGDAGGQADAAGRSQHPLLAAPQSPLAGLLARHIGKTFIES